MHGRRKAAAEPPDVAAAKTRERAQRAARFRDLTEAALRMVRVAPVRTGAGVAGRPTRTAAAQRRRSG